LEKKGYSNFSADRKKKKEKEKHDVKPAKKKKKKKRPREILPKRKRRGETKPQGGRKGACITHQARGKREKKKRKNGSG